MGKRPRVKCNRFPHLFLDPQREGVTSEVEVRELPPASIHMLARLGQEPNPDVVDVSRQSLKSDDVTQAEVFLSKRYLGLTEQINFKLARAEVRIVTRAA